MLFNFLIQLKDVVFLHPPGKVLFLVGGSIIKAFPIPFQSIQQEQIVTFVGGIQRHEL